MNDQYLQTTHGKLRYWENQGTGTPLVLIPGFGASLEIWKNNFAELGKKHTVYAIEPIGAGKSDKPIIQYDLATMVSSIKEFLDAKDIKKIALMGSSLGGAISMAFTTRFPTIVEKLILVGSAGFSRHIPFSFRILSLPWIGEFLLRLSKREGVKKVLQSFVYNPAAITEDMVNTAYKISQLPRQKEVMLNILRTQTNILGVKKNIFEQEFKHIQEINIPILLIWGKQDPVIRFVDTQVALKILPHAKLHTFDPCGHLPQIECVEEFNRVVDGFLALR